MISSDIMYIFISAQTITCENVPAEVVRQQLYQLVQRKEVTRHINVDDTRRTDTRIDPCKLIA